MPHPVAARSLKRRQQSVVDCGHAAERVLVECINGPCLADRHEHCAPLDDKRGRLFVCLCDCHEASEGAAGATNSGTELQTLRAILREERPNEAALLAMLGRKKS